eukprot:TRINITY_DN207_c5_g1_i1.p1 TRINITY_DN207_c5_g1~~TRINITY_DN207_c5_g1_i1.p1  ORF type:complete len:156 (+),score=30.53 TRINITY_DN207_c5_g1_i1:71-469(+)
MSEVIALQSLSIEPNNCPFSDPVVISIQFDSKGVEAATWKVAYEADVTNKRHVIELCQQGPIDYSAGNHSVDLKIPSVNTEGVKTRYLMTMGILKCALFSGDEEVSSINIVTQVSKDESGKLVRLMMSPVEE